MIKEEIFAIWAPENSVWSTWAKPVLFAHMGSALAPPANATPLPDATWAPAASEKFALVLDLPGDEAVWVSVSLAGHGYRPVPLYNALPLPSDALILDSTQRSVAAINVTPILTALQQTAPQLLSQAVPSDAPPCFLLDSRRRGDGLTVEPEQFDNRSVSFTTDFPSANFLLTHGVERVLLVQRERTEPRPDLAHTLRRWQDGGLPLERLHIENPGDRQSFEVSRPSWYGMMFQRALAAWGLRRAAGGGFGAWMHESSSGG